MSEDTVITVSDQRQSVAYVYLTSLSSPISRRVQGSALRVISRKLGAGSPFDFKWEELRFQHLASIQSWLASTHSATATRRYVSAVRGCLRAAWRMGYLDTDTYVRTIDLTPVHGNTKRGKYVTQDELDKLYGTCQSGSNRDARDLAILMVMFRLGLRCCEVLAAQLADFDRNTGALLLHGKGKKLRTVFVLGNIRAAMDQWLVRRGEHVGALWEVIEWDDTISHRPIGATLSLWELYDRRCRRAGISRVSPHDSRRTACSNLLSETDSLTVARILGHSSLSITAIYDRRNESATRDACEKAGEL